MSDENKATDEDKAALMAMVGGPEEAGTEDKAKDEESKPTETDNGSDKTEETESAQTDSDVDEWKALSRKWESRAKENKEKADAHDALVTKVSELETQLTKASEAQTEVTRWKVAAKYGISEEDVALFLTADDEETLEKQAGRLSQTSAKTPKPDTAQGTRTSAGPPSTKAQGAAALEGLFN